MSDDRALLSGLILGGLGPLAVGAALTPFRAHAQVNGLVVVVLVVVIATAAALGGPFAGGSAAVVSALTFDFLFVRPHLVLKVGPTRDTWPAALLLAVGVVVVRITQRNRPERAAPRQGDAGAPSPSERIERVAQLVEHGAPANVLVATVEAEVAGVLSARSCRFEPTHVGTGRPRLERSGSVAGRSWSPDLPSGEVEIVLRLGADDIGRLVVAPTLGVPVSLEHRIAALILADHLAAAMSGRTPTDVNGGQCPRL